VHVSREAIPALAAAVFHSVDANVNDHLVAMETQAEDAEVYTGGHFFIGFRGRTYTKPSAKGSGREIKEEKLCCTVAPSSCWCDSRSMIFFVRLLGSHIAVSTFLFGHIWMV
jgi:hypothetical protein